MEAPRHQLPSGHVLEERDADLFGHVQVYAVLGTSWEVVRTARGWRARTARHDHARRALKGPAYGSAPQVVGYLAKHGHIAR